MGVMRIEVFLQKVFKFEYDKLWWLHTPEGHAFLSFGLYHVGLEMLRRAENTYSWCEEFNLEPGTAEYIAFSIPVD
jgi:hypothetical protein